MLTATLLQPTTAETAPEGSREALAQVKQGYGFVPNLLATMANSPATLNGYLAMDAAFERGTLSPRERQIVQLAASRENACGYCTAAHTTVLRDMLKASPEVVAAARDEAPADPRTDALVRLTRELVRERGVVSPAAIEGFLAAGFSRPQVLEVLLGVTLKTLSNYMDHLSPVEVDAAFQGGR